VLDLETRVLGDRDVVTPGRSREVNGLGSRVVSSQESSSDSQSTGTRNRLGDGELSRQQVLALLERNTHSVLDKRLRVLSVGQLGRELGEGGKTLGVSC
jgi:hypothetical protein